MTLDTPGVSPWVFITARVAAEAAPLTVSRTQKLGDYQLTAIAEHMCVYRYQLAESAAAVRAAFPGAHIVALADVPQLVDQPNSLNLPLHYPTTLVLRELLRQGKLE